jgi:uracil DNA glycosylase
LTRHEKWQAWLENELRQPYAQRIIETAKNLDKNFILSPDRDLWFRSLEFPDITKIHTIITSSRPHKEAYASDGLAFSSIGEADRETGFLYRKLYSELGVIYDQYDNSKTRWLEQGVLCLPIELTTKSGQGHDQTQLWYPFTTRVLRYFIEENQNRAFIFLDQYSQKNYNLFYDRNERPHFYYLEDIRFPDFLKRPLFKDLNKFIWENYQKEIDWS